MDPKWLKRDFWKDLWARHQRVLTAAGGALLLASVLSQLEFQYFEAIVYDALVTRSQSQRPSTPQDDAIVLVTIDERTQEELGEFAPLAIQRHSEFLNRIAAYKPRAVGYLVNMLYVSQEDPEAFAGTAGQEFVSLARNLESSGIPFLMGTPFDVNGEVLPPFPASSLPHSIAIVHKDGNIFGRDHVTRRALVDLYQRPAFHLELARRTGLMTPAQSVRGASPMDGVDSQFALFKFTKPAFAEVSFSDVLSGRAPTESLAGKIVLVGTQLRKNPSDFSRTPITKSGDPESKLQIHATILDAFAHQNTLVIAPRAIEWLLMILISTLVLWSVMTLSPLEGVLTTAGFAGFSALATYIFFLGPLGLPGIYIPLSKVLVALVLSYYSVVPFRLIREYRKRWTFQRENEVLVQVEKLKTNFLNLVTHDLKTPVARIQGLADQSLHQSDRAALTRNLQNIVASTEELNRFITSILDISKAETNALQPSLESKDINTLLETCVAGFEPQAAAKGITLATDFEPLFPVRLDPALMTKVFNNLIDNAIKYSPESSTVTLSTREIGDTVQVRIEDQGIGLTPEEREQLFKRFFRARHSQAGSVPGSGLGLYLAKYFIEAHQGTIRVESRPGSGSIFIVELPVKGPALLVKGLTTLLKPATQTAAANSSKETDHA